MASLHGIIEPLQGSLADTALVMGSTIQTSILEINLIFIVHPIIMKIRDSIRTNETAVMEYILDLVFNLTLYLCSCLAWLDGAFSLYPKFTLI